MLGSIVSVENLCQFTVVVLHTMTFINYHVPPANLDKQMRNKNNRDLEVPSQFKIVCFYTNNLTLLLKCKLKPKDLQSRSKRVETLCLLKILFQSRSTSLFSFTPPPILMLFWPQNLLDNLTYSTSKRGRGESIEFNAISLKRGKNADYS